MSARPASDTQKKHAKRLKKLAEDEIGARPKHQRCIDIVMRSPMRGETAEAYAARLFVENEAELRESAGRRSDATEVGDG